MLRIQIGKYIIFGSWSQRDLKSPFTFYTVTFIYKYCI